MDSDNPGELSFTFKLGAGDYRRAMYFNTFSRQPRQTWLLFTAWVFSLGIILLERFALIGQLEKITHGCLMLVSVLVPALVATAEFAVYRFKSNHPEELAAERTVRLTEEGIAQSRDDREESHFEAWSGFECVYETGALFIFYRSAKELILLPKRVVPPDGLPLVRNFLSDKSVKYRAGRGSRSAES